MVPTVIPGTLWLWRRGARAYAPCWLAGVPAQSRRWRKTSVCPRGWFDLADAREAAAALADTAGVAHFAGPFSATSAQMIDACLASQPHYLDITGELDIFLAAQRRHADAQAAGIVIWPGRRVRRHPYPLPGRGAQGCRTQRAGGSLTAATPQFPTHFQIGGRNCTTGALSTGYPLGDHGPPYLRAGGGAEPNRASILGL
jgi:hypothetical protein